MSETVRVWQETVLIPTYVIGEQDSNPMFLEQRVYQGSSGEVYPYAVIDSLTGQKHSKEYQALYIENDYIKVMLLPQVGGRIQKAYDKIQKRDFVYHNEVIKPALVGLLGPWISGGIEFNWPQHHRPTTYMPVDYTLQQHDDGSCTVWLGEIEPMRGLQLMVGYKLYPNRALIEINAKVYNANETPRHFLWWANPAVKGGDDHQSVFPPDVTAVFDHGKRDVSSFPIATGTYYKVDYSAGVDISRYKNVPVPTSYMADHSDYDFVGAYSHDDEGGLLHIADHHISPGKKQWSWGNCEFGQAWDRNLTDNNGPYIELMTGVYTDNQPDFTWLDAYEEKCFTQYFLPYSSLGMVQNASTLAALKLERQKNQMTWGVYAVESLNNYQIIIYDEGERQAPLLTQTLTLTAAQAIKETLVEENTKRLTIELIDPQGRSVLKYSEHIPTEQPLPSPAKAPLAPEKITSVDEAWFIGQHIDQYNHASRASINYYLRGVEIDPYDYRCNLALAMLEYNRANFEEALVRVNAALKRAQMLNKNPQCGQASLLRACIYERKGEFDRAYDDFYQAIWSGNTKEGGFFGLARIANRRGDYTDALSFTESALIHNSANYELICLKAILLNAVKEQKVALNYVDAQLEQYPLLYTLYFVRYLITTKEEDALKVRQLTGCRGMNALAIANTLVSFGMELQAIEALSLLDSQETLPQYLLITLLKPSLNQADYLARLKVAGDSFSQNVRFPNSLAEVMMLEKLPECSFANYLLGCFHYSKRSYQRAVSYWRTSIDMNPDFAPVWRNMAVYYYNKCHDVDNAEHCYLRALSLVPNDARLLFELDYLHKLNGMAVQERLNLLEPKQDVVLKRDDLTAELLSLYNLTLQPEKAMDILLKRDFYPWEGGEGKVTGQYMIALQLQAFAKLKNKQVDETIALLHQALVYPPNLGEGRLVVQTDNDLYFWLGICARQSGNPTLAKQYFTQATAGQHTLAQSRYYNDQPVDYLFYQAMALRQLGQNESAQAILQQMQQWVVEARNQTIEADFFAVSLPELVVLNQDINKQYQEHVLFVQALAELGLGNMPAYRQCAQALNDLNPNHIKLGLFNHLLALVGEAYFSA